MLVVVGDLFSGKSHYIAALIHQIQTEWMSKAVGFARFRCQTPDIEEYYTQEYFKPLFADKRTLAPTQQATSAYARPLIYELTVGALLNHPTTVVNLMIYDASGEDFMSQNRLVDYARFALNTSAFIFVADPFTMEPFFSGLSPVMKTALQSRRAANRLNDIISLYERFRRAPTGGSLPSTPIAVMLSKSDMFKYPGRPTYHFMTNPDYSGGVDMDDLRFVDQQVQELLKTYNQGDLITATSRFRQKMFFATSSTGEPPDSNGNFQNVQPCRCLDPVLWILHQLGIIR
jgi:hypothetical protein